VSGLWLISYVALWILLLAVAVVLVSVLRNLGVMTEALRTLQESPADRLKLKPGEAVPDVALQTLSGEPVQLSALAQQPTAFALVSPGCKPCHLLLESLAALDMTVDPLGMGVQQTVVVSVGAVEDTMSLLTQLDIPSRIPILADPESQLFTAWGITATPTTVVVDDQTRYVSHTSGFMQTEMEPGTLQSTA
jgi:peroxiredoxin